MDGRQLDTSDIIKKGTRLVLKTGLDCIVITPVDEQGWFTAVDYAEILGKQTHHIDTIASILPSYYELWGDNKDYESPYAR